MLIKEYRIPLPLTVEEYRIGQLYMIAKKSREESQGVGSGVEILVNEPYEHGPGALDDNNGDDDANRAADSSGGGSTSGQFTHKLFHVGSHLPGWLKSLLPKSVRTIEEKAWNAYPYTKTRYTCPFVDRFSLEIETKYFDDAGDQENVFCLSGSDLRNREIDLIDIVKDQLPASDYLESEDPVLYVSQKSNRGPLGENWIDEHRHSGTIMCAYKLCRVEFKYWGVQTKVERFIDDIALRKMMLRAHRQAWAWQDEWLGLTMEDVRQIEAETQAELARKMAAAAAAGDPEAVAAVAAAQAAATEHLLDERSTSAAAKDATNVGDGESDAGSGGGSSTRAGSAKSTSRPVAVASTLAGGGRRSDANAACRHQQSPVEAGVWRLEAIERDSDSAGSDQYFDAEDFDDDVPSQPLTTTGTAGSVTATAIRTSIGVSGLSGAADALHLSKWSSAELIQNSSEGGSADEAGTFTPMHAPRRTQDRLQEQTAASHLFDVAVGSNSSSPATSPGHHLCHFTTSAGATPCASKSVRQETSSSTVANVDCPTSVLVLVLHAGTVLDAGHDVTHFQHQHQQHHKHQQGQFSSSKAADVATFAGVLDTVIRDHYSALWGRIAVRLVVCPSLCSDALATLDALSPFGFMHAPVAADKPSLPGADRAASNASERNGAVACSPLHCATAAGVGRLHYSERLLPAAALPLFATSSVDYTSHLNATILAANRAYAEFLQTPEGMNFDGQVVLIGDSLGSVLAFDALARSSAAKRASFGGKRGSNDNNIKAVDSTSNGGNVGGAAVKDDVQQRLVDNNASGRQPDGANGEPAWSAVDRSGKSTCAFTANSELGDARQVLSAAAPTSAAWYNRMESIDEAGDGGVAVGVDCLGPLLDFEPADLFMFGSPMALVLCHRQFVTGTNMCQSPVKPFAGTQVYNLFYPIDPLGLRVEPLISSKFAQLAPVNVPRFQKYPLGDGQPIHLLEFVQSHAHLFGATSSAGLDSFAVVAPGAANPSSQPGGCTLTSSQAISGVTWSSHVTAAGSADTSRSSSSGGGNGMVRTSSVDGRRISEASILSAVSCSSEATLFVSAAHALSSRWWGTKRIDYALYCPEGLASCPAEGLPHLLHASYWESTDVASFVVRQLVRRDPQLQRYLDSDTPAPSFVPGQPRERWLKKRTSVKIKNITANHRANDVIVKEGLPQILAARFAYGPLDMVNLNGEKVDIHIMRDTRVGEWTFMTTEQTDKNGRILWQLPESRALGCGMYPVKMVVRGDHTAVDFFLAVVPPHTEAVVFSINGSFTASVSVSGRDPKVRAGAVDVVRHWQELGYLIIYVSSRPDRQQRCVLAWLVQHNFPHGLVSFAEGLSTGPQQHKLDYLLRLQNNADLIYHAAYGSSKDISIYSALGISSERIFVSGKTSKKQMSQAVVLNEGYAQHLLDLRTPSSCSLAALSRPASGNARLLLSSATSLATAGAAPSRSANFSSGSSFGSNLLARHRRSTKRPPSHSLPPRSPTNVPASTVERGGSACHGASDSGESSVGSSGRNT